MGIGYRPAAVGYWGDHSSEAGADRMEHMSSRHRVLQLNMMRSLVQVPGDDTWHANGSRGQMIVMEGCKGVEGVELLRDREVQHLHVYRCRGEPSPSCPERPSPRRRPRGTRPWAQGEGEVVAHGRLSLAFSGHGADQSMSGRALARVERAIR